MSNSHPADLKSRSTDVQRVRFGGVQTADRYLFELTGGRLCLDFANTLDERESGQPRELLRLFTSLIEWGLQAGALLADEANALRDHASAHPRAAANALVRAVTFRERLFAIFSAVARGTSVPDEALSPLDRAARKGCGSRRLQPSGDRFEWGWRSLNEPDLDRVLSRVAWSAVDLLVSPELSRVRLCEGAGCGWLFLDSSRNRTRRWCDMTVCGNRAKARRHYARTRPQKC